MCCRRRSRGLYIRGGEGPTVWNGEDAWTHLHRSSINGAIAFREPRRKLIQAGRSAHCDVIGGTQQTQQEAM